jgi:ankyrin repeat protein
MRMKRSQLVSLAAAVALWIAGAGAAAPDVRLIEAVKAGDGSTVRLLLKAHVPVDTAEADGTTALHWAVRADDRETVALLLHAGASPSAVNRYGVTPLSLAALNGSLDVTRALVVAGADPNARLAEGQTALMAAARAGNPDVVQVLLDAGADAEASEQELGETALMWAAHEDHVAVVETLAAYGADVDARSHVNHFSRFKFGDGIVARPTVLAKGGWTAVMYAARQNAVDAIRALAGAGADLDATDPDGTNALVLAIINAHYVAAAALLDAGANPNIADVTGMTALYAAVDMHTLDETVGVPNPKPHGRLAAPAIIAALLAHGANPNARLKSPILDRVHNDGDTSLGENATPLMRAAKDADVEVMQLLLDHGADPSLTTTKGTTALMYVVSRSPGFRGSRNRGSEQQAVAAIDLCLARGVDIDTVDASGQSALHVAAASPAEEAIVRHLAERGASLSLKDRRGRTALDAATSAGRGRGGAVAGDVADAGASGAGARRAHKIALLRQLMGLPVQPAATQDPESPVHRGI